MRQFGRTGFRHDALKFGGIGFCMFLQFARSRTTRWHCLISRLCGGVLIAVFANIVLLAGGAAEACPQGTELSVAVRIHHAAKKIDLNRRAEVRASVTAVKVAASEKCGGGNSCCGSHHSPCAGCSGACCVAAAGLGAAGLIFMSADSAHIGLVFLQNVLASADLPRNFRPPQFQV